MNWPWRSALAIVPLLLAAAAAQTFEPQVAGASGPSPAALIWVCVVAPAALFTYVIWRGEGPRAAAAMAPLLLMLYLGLYLALRFHPAWWPLLVFAAAPLWLLRTGPDPAAYLAPEGGAWRLPPRPAHGGFGTTGFGSFGA